MSLRSMARLGDNLSVFGQKVFLGGGPSPSAPEIHTESTELKIYIGGASTPSATFESDGGILHGSWNVESSLVTSDRRLKTNIMPLQRTLRDVIAPRGDKKEPSAPDARSKGAAGDGALWLLRQLRPVSYSFRKGVDSKYMRFGFIADELDAVVPEVVRRPGDREVTDQKAVVYQDLIALLASASQSQQKLIEELQATTIANNAMLKKLLEQENDKQRKGKGSRKSRRAKAAKAAKQMANATNDTNLTNTTNATIV